MGKVHERNTNDSYKSLNGKWPEKTQREPCLPTERKQTLTWLTHSFSSALKQLRKVVILVWNASRDGPAQSVSNLQAWADPKWVHSSLPENDSTCLLAQFGGVGL